MTKYHCPHQSVLIVSLGTAEIAAESHIQSETVKKHVVFGLGCRICAQEKVWILN